MPMDTEADLIRWNGDVSTPYRDRIAIEAPLEILVNGRSLAVTMRTPGADFDLAAGFLFTESIILSASDIRSSAHCGALGDPDEQNLLNVVLHEGVKYDSEKASLQRNFLATSSCGVCGKATLSAVQCKAPPLPDSSFTVLPSVLRSLNDELREAQSAFERTGGLHAAGLFTLDGELLSVREDVGRHNAVDKLIGSEALANRTPLSERIMMISGRASFEIMQKAAVARIPVICAVSAPSSLAVQMAKDLNMTLVGFLRGETMNVYAGAERIKC